MEVFSLTTNRLISLDRHETKEELEAQDLSDAWSQHAQAGKGSGIRISLEVCTVCSKVHSPGRPLHYIPGKQSVTSHKSKPYPTQIVLI